MTQRLTGTAQRFVAEALYPGAIALDATAGTGADTLFLARAIGAEGRVYAFDIQPEAIARARRRIEEAGVGARVVWHEACHSTLSDRVGDLRFSAAMFNLGWLPGGASTMVTQPATTLSALVRTATHLRPGGRLAILAYRGHSGGQEEQAAVAAWIDGSVHGLERMATIATGSAARPGPVLYALRRPPVRPRVLLHRYRTFTARKP